MSQPLGWREGRRLECSMRVCVCVCVWSFKGWRQTKEPLHLFRKLNEGVYSSNINNSFKVEVSGIEAFTKLSQLSKALWKTERNQCLCLCVRVCLWRHIGACGDLQATYVRTCCVFVVCTYIVQCESSLCCEGMRCEECVLWGCEVWAVCVVRVWGVRSVSGEVYGGVQMWVRWCGK